ncbi:NPC1-like intracellular cholesterol transporter 1 isoform X2 [Corythoichthys intestinalis]|uniref:NPC1-like intracellular cholesterol transporter 1 isoform X2 n=1 Tax=Corythoichthys intestinalis TaxID=161448 RepID=UPI0025A6281E|nr:NPC1-like intracellular cholesterol transporter 1 isoform X2 [Corythoichthys intestinalis]
MNVVAALITFLTCTTVQVLSQNEHRPGYCAFYEECGRNPLLGDTLIPPIVPCRNFSQARALTGEHYKKLQEVCPMLDKGPGSTFACCSLKQLKSLDMSLTLSKALLVRCPSCAENFAHLHCINTCSPNQSQSVKVTKVMNVTSLGKTREAVVEYQAYLSTSFSDASFYSCQNVRIPATGGFAIGTMCGRYGAKLCTPQRWYDFQGDSSNGLAPLDIDFRLIKPGETEGIPEGVIPYSGRALNCNETTPSGGQVCSCQDCKSSCPVLPPPQMPPGPFRLLGTDGFFVITIIVFALLIYFFIFFLMFSCWIKSKKNQDENKVEKKGRDQKCDSVNQQVIHPSEVTCADKNSMAAQAFLSSVFQSWGTIMASYPFTVLLVSAVVVAAFAAGLMSIELTTDPVELWSAPSSRARQEKEFHDKHFGPFFRTNQLILTAPGRKGYIYDSLLFGQQNFSGLVSKELIIEMLLLQKKIQNIEFWSEDLNRTASLKDVCFAPLNPNNSSLTDCAVNSLPQYFQNSLDNINAKVNMTELGVTKEVDWRDHLIYCLSSPLSFKDITALGLSCMADYGAPVFPFLAVGGYLGDEYTNAEAFILTFSLNNYPRTHVKYNVAMQWEKEFLKIVQDYQRDPTANFTFAYMAERSLEDEINRTTAEDIPIFMISYAVIFVYIAVALGEYSSWRRILVDSKFLVGFGGILVVGCSVLASMGFYSWIGIPSSLVILQVVPFLVLAVGADNIFIFVLEYQRDVRKPNETREQQIGRVLGNVAPSMLLCSLSESVCFFLGALSTMPAVKSFALYAALAVLMDFVLQMTSFVALLSLDARRQDNNRCELLCCVTVSAKKSDKPNEGFLLPLMRNYYAPVLLNQYIRFIVMVVFIFMFSGSLYLMFHVTVGLDQELAMPKGSYMLDYFQYLYKYLEVGVPVYFVTKKGFNFTTEEGMNAVCSSVGCDQFSMTQKIQYAANYPELVTNVFYEQYLTIVPEGLFNISLCLLPTFVVCCLLLGLDLRSGLLNLITIIMITVDTVGVMTLWDIHYNAVALINLVTAVGISVEFVSHMTRSFALSTKSTRVERAKEATANMGSAVFAGVAMTNLPGILVLAFAKAQLIQIFFFRLNLVITLLGMAHGLIFLPVVLSYLGPGVNKAVLLQIQQEQTKTRQELELTNSMRQFYDNMNFEDSETNKEPHSNVTQAPMYTKDPSPSTEHEQEENIDWF